MCGGVCLLEAMSVCGSHRVSDFFIGARDFNKAIIN